MSQKDDVRVSTGFSLTPNPADNAWSGRFALVSREGLAKACFSVPLIDVTYPSWSFLRVNGTGNCIKQAHNPLILGRLGTPMLSSPVALTNPRCY
jgi:hypothetical protein